MRAVLAFACRAFPPDHRARLSDEVVDTALLAAGGSPWGAGRESLSLVLAGVRERCRAEPRRSLRDGVTLLAGLFALVNLGVALYGISFAVSPNPHWDDFPQPYLPNARFHDPFAVDWWWIAFGVAAVAIVLGLALGNRMLAICAAVVNLGLVGYDAIFLAGGGGGHMTVFGWLQGPDGYPVGQEWLAPAIVLALATAVAARHRHSLLRLPFALLGATVLVVLARHHSGGLIFLQWPVALLILLAVTLGWFLPRLAVVALGVSAVLAPYIVEYLTGPSWAYRAPAVTWIAAPGLALGILLPLVYLARRRRLT